MTYHGCHILSLGFFYHFTIFLVRSQQWDLDKQQHIMTFVLSLDTHDY